jgi:hypothetical protein
MKALARTFVVLAVCGSIFGCGGSGQSPTAAGSLTFKLKWPAQASPSLSRLIPYDTTYIQADLIDQNGEQHNQFITRPTGGPSSATAIFTGVIAGQATLQVFAFPDSKSGDIAQAIGSVNCTVPSVGNSNVTVTLADTISYVITSPATPTIAVGATQQLTLTAHDAQGDIVAISTSTIQWSSATKAVATVSSSGLVTGVSPGTSVITGTETESGKSYAATVMVQ